MVETDPNYKAVSFHSQQCGEKYLKAYLQQKSVNPERTHDLGILFTKILPFEPNWQHLRESCLQLTEFAIDHRYPGTTTSAQDADDALRHAGLIRRTVRQYFDLQDA